MLGLLDRVLTWRRHHDRAWHEACYAVAERETDWHDATTEAERAVVALRGIMVMGDRKRPLRAQAELYADHLRHERAIGTRARRTAGRMLRAAARRVDPEGED